MQGAPGGKGARGWGQGKTNLVSLVPFPFVLVGSSRNFRNPELVHLGGWRREFGAVPIYAVNPAWLSPPVPLQANSGVWPHQGQTQAGSSVFQKPCPFPTGGKGLPGRVEKEHLPLCCINCCLGLHDFLPLDFCQGDPGPEIPPAAPSAPDPPRRDGALHRRQSQA